MEGSRWPDATRDEGADRCALQYRSLIRGETGGVFEPVEGTPDPRPALRAAGTEHEPDAPGLTCGCHRVDTTVKIVIDDGTAGCSCGAANPPSSRFCSSCGRPLIGDVQLIDDGAAIAGEHGPAPLQTSSSTRWLLGVGVLLAAVIAWSAIAASPPPEDLADGFETDDEVEIEESSTTTNPPRTTTTDPDRTDSTRRTTTTTAPVEVIGDGGPLLGEETGFDLLIGLHAQRPSRLDLDTGEIVHVDEPGAFNPILVSGSFVVGRLNDSISVLPIDDLAAKPHVLGGSTTYYELVSRAARTDGRAVFLEQPFDSRSPAMQLVDLATLETVETYPPPEGVAVNYWGGFGLSSDPALVNTFAGGVYERLGDDRFIRRSPGRMLAVDGARVLVERCDERLTCERAWLDRQNWSDTDLRVPDEMFDSAWMLNDTNWMFYATSGPEWEPRLFNIVDGRDIAMAQEIDFWSFGIAISPDGRWHAHVRAGGVVVTDLDSGVQTIVADEGLRPSGALVFVEQQSE